jgi:hypothetical protein
VKPFWCQHTATERGRVVAQLARGTAAPRLGVKATGVEAPSHRRRAFGITYHPAHVNRLLHALRHSVGRDEQAIKAAIRQVDNSV